MSNAQSYLRIWDIIGSEKRNIKPLIPISRSGWLAKVKCGQFPAPIHLGRCVLWRAEDIATLINNLNFQINNTKKEVPMKEPK